jgi:hypothetical protein
MSDVEDSDTDTPNRKITRMLAKKSPEERAYFLEGLAGGHASKIAGRAMELPNCIVIGAAKSGTTSLVASLAKHADVFACKPKEPKFFSQEYFQGWDWYFHLFRKANGAQIRMEGSTRYTCGQGLHSVVPQMLRNYIPDAKLIYICRHPMERLVSNWRHRKALNPVQTGEFNAFFEQPDFRRYLVGSSSYWARLSEYRAFFPDSQILALTFEDMIAEPETIMKRILDFLGLPTTPESIGSVLKDGKFEHVNEVGAQGRAVIPKPEWNQKFYQRVRNIIAPDARQFLAHIGKPEDYWKEL